MPFRCHRLSVGRYVASAAGASIRDVEVVLRTRTPEGVDVVLSALVYAEILEELTAVADFVPDRPDHPRAGERHADPRPGRERFFRHDGGLWVMAVVDFDGVPAIIVTVFSAARSPA